MPNGWELVIILGIIALLFGGAKLPKLARSLGSAKGEFEKGLKEGSSSDKDAKKSSGPKQESGSSSDSSESSDS